MGGSNSSQTCGDDAISTSMTGRRRRTVGCRMGWLLYNCVQLSWKGLGGRISKKIEQQQALRRLSLHDNELVGAVPMSLGFLRNLRGVYLFNNRLSGSIPAAIGNCPLLQTFGLSNNQLNGVIPPSLGDSAKLYRLNLSFNGVSGSIPLSLSQSSSLTFLLFSIIICLVLFPILGAVGMFLTRSSF
ncbi:hypothetical protein ACS0TY_004558 [Phlomoides rotata]